MTRLSLVLEREKRCEKQEKNIYSDGFLPMDFPAFSLACKIKAKAKFHSILTAIRPNVTVDWTPRTRFADSNRPKHETGAGCWPLAQPPAIT